MQSIFQQAIRKRKELERNEKTSLSVFEMWFFVDQIKDRFRDIERLLRMTIRTMVNKLLVPRNMVKKPWTELTDEELLNLLDAEIHELKIAINDSIVIFNTKNPTDDEKRIMSFAKVSSLRVIEDECVDVINFAAFIMDNARTKAFNIEAAAGQNPVGFSQELPFQQIMTNIKHLTEV